MRTIRIITVVGARPQFVKAAAVSRAIAAHNAAGDGPTIEERIVHTGQHYDEKLSKIFFDELEIPRPAVNLNVGSGSHAAQTAAMLTGLEAELTAHRPDWALIYGDTNSTLAGAMAAAKLGIRIVHVEAGLRSFNRAMPEEINRILADRISSLLMCPTAAAVANLTAEGMTEGVHQVGDVMYDSVLHNTALSEQRSTIVSDLALEAKGFYLATVHRASNTDDPARLGGILAALAKMGPPVILPLHPRTRGTLGAKPVELGETVRVIEPVAHLDMLALERAARIILTDSGGMQKEAYWAGVPCVTLRDETEWVELVEIGCNRLAGADPARILAAVEEIESADAVLPATATGDLYGDGHSAERILDALVAATQ